MTFSSCPSALVFSPQTTRATFTKCQSCTLPLGQIRLHFTTRANSMKRRTENAFAAARRRAMHEAAGAPPQLTDGACAAAQSTGAAALRRILQARPLALRVHRERAIVDQSTDLWAADLHGGRAQRKDNRGPRMLARMRTRCVSCRPGGGRPGSPPERPCPGSAMSERGAVSNPLRTLHTGALTAEGSRGRLQCTYF